jgi:hypothetical protein
MHAKSLKGWGFGQLLPWQTKHDKNTYRKMENS